MIDEHLSAHDVASYVDRTASRERKSRILAHLSHCADCRDEVADVSRVVTTGTGGGVRRHRALLPAVAAAALLLTWVGAARMTSSPPVVHRDQASAGSAVPLPHAPIGRVIQLPGFVWTSVVYADRYRVRLYDRDGRMLWEHEGADTTVAAPATPLLKAGAAYFWKVEARTGFERWVTSELIEFELERAPPR